MPKLWVNQEGTWKQVKVLWVKRNGTWVNPKIGIINQGGVGKQFYPDAQLDVSYTVPGRYTYTVPSGVTDLKIVAQGGGGGGGMGAFRRIRNYVVWLSYEKGKKIKGNFRRNYLNPIILPEGYFPEETVRYGNEFPTLAAAAGQSDWALHKSSWEDGLYELLWYPDTVFVGSDDDDDLDEYQVRWTSFEYGIDVDARIEGGGAPEYGSLSDIYLPLGVYPEATLGDPDYKVNFSLDLPGDYLSYLHIPSHRPRYYARRWVPGVPFKRTLIARGRDGYPGKRLEGNLAVTAGDIITVDVGGGGYPGGARRIITGFTSNTFSETTTVSKTYTKSIDIVVPAGVTSLTLTATGGGGGAGGPDEGGPGFTGYSGASISGTLAVTPGANVSISIGGGGGGGSYVTNGGGGVGGVSNLGYNGGAGGKSGPTGVSGGGGGGGAATVIKYNGTIVAVAGGGGGGGGAGLYSPGAARNVNTLVAGIAGGAGGNKGTDPAGTGSNYSFTVFTVVGVDSGGGGPTGSTGGPLGSLPASTGGFIKYLGQSVQIPNPQGCGLNLRNYWSKSSTSQTYQSPKDAVFLVNGSNWTSSDLTTLGITVADVSYIYSGNSPTISIVTDMDDYAGFGYYTITKSGTVTFSRWSTGTYTQLKTSYQGASGRQRGVVIGSFALPIPGANDLIVLAWRDNAGINNVKYTITYPILSTNDGGGGGGGGGGVQGGIGGLAVTGDDKGAYSGVNGTNLLPGGWTVGAGGNGGSINANPITASGKIEYNTPGRYDWAVPAGVVQITVSLTGGGGGGGGGGYGSGGETGGSGGGGGSGYSNTATINVTPGEVLTVFVGAGGVGGLPHYSRPSRSGFALQPSYYGGNGASSRITRSGGSILVSAAGGGGGNPGVENGQSPAPIGGIGFRNGGSGTYVSSGVVAGGNGGASAIGTPTVGVASVSGPSPSGKLGSGGAGGAARDSSDTAVEGGAGGSGFVSLTWGGAVKLTPGGDGVNGSVTVTYAVTNTYQVVNPIVTTSLFNSEGGTSTLGYNGGKGSTGGVDIITASDKDEFKFYGEVRTYVVPLGISTVYISMTGGGGGRGGNDSAVGHPGFSGQQIRGNLKVNPGDTIAFYVGSAGESGEDNDNEEGGKGGLCRLEGFDGGIGGAAGKRGRSGSGGGGGAATVITLNGTVVAVAAGGGGGGGGGDKSTGAGQAALTYNTSTNGGNGQSKTGNRVVSESTTKKIFYDKAGTREFIVPAGLTSIKVSIIGGGAGGGHSGLGLGSIEGGGGGKAGTVVTSTIPVTPGEKLIFNIGKGGRGIGHMGFSFLTNSPGTPTTIYRGNTLLLIAAGGVGTVTGNSIGAASAAPFNQPGGKPTTSFAFLISVNWITGAPGYLGSGGSGGAGKLHSLSGAGGDGAVQFEIPEYVTISEDDDDDGGGGGGGGGGYPTGGAGGLTRPGDVGAYSGITGKNLLPSGWTVASGGNPGKDGTAFISPSAKFDAGRVGGGGGGAATVIQKNGVTIAVAAGGGGGGAGLYADSLAQTSKYVSSGTHAGGAAYTESERNDRGVGGGGGGGGSNGGAGSQGFNFANEIGLVADYNWINHDKDKCFDRQNNYTKIDADVFDTVLGRYLTTKFKSHYFKGNNKSYARIKYNSKFALTLVKGSNLSLEAWICATGRGQEPTYGGIIINKDSDYEVARLSDGRIAVAFDWGVGTDVNLPGGGWIIPPAGTAVVPLNEAAYVVVSLANTVLNIYINGALAWTKTGLDRQPTNSNNDIYIGNRPGLYQGFQGYITNVRFWNVARTAEQVKQDYDAYTWGGRPDFGPSSGYSGQSLVPVGWKEYLASGETFTTTVSAVIDLDRRSTWTLGTNSTVGEYTNFKYLTEPDDRVFKSNVLVFGYGINSTTSETRSLTTNTKVNLTPYNTLLYEVNKGTIKDWGQEPEPGEDLYLEYSLDGSTWSVVDKVLPSIVKANKWYTRQLALTQRGIRNTDGVYLRFRQTRAGQLSKPRDTWAVSPLIAVTQKVIGIANPGYRQEFGFYATKGGDGLAMISSRDANLTTYFAAGTYSYTVPVGITELLVTVVGGGGGSASTISTAAAGGAGGSGGIQEDQTITVIPGETLTIEVGDGGAGGSGTGSASTGRPGGVSRILRDTTLIIEARGGQGGTKDSTGQGGAGGAGGTPTGDRGDNGPILAGVAVSSGGGQNALGIGNGGNYAITVGSGNPGAVGFVSIGFVG